DGLVKSNPVFRLVLGTCPTLALTTAAMNGVYMGICTTFVLLCSNVLVSALRKIIPDKVRIPAFMLVIATFVTIVEMVLRKFLPDIYSLLGLYLPLIVVNCIILARAEAFASMNTILDSALDGLGMGLGFTLSLIVMGGIREFIGAGSIFGFAIPGFAEKAPAFFILPAGGFLVFGLLIAAVNWLSKKAEDKMKAKAASGVHAHENMTEMLEEAPQ
ncbi:MAG TPA: electron transport complex subunit E, partial [Eubacteriales bacterium]|nr:electron transport complex subunit E [Eubacteriales bacterium]